MLRATPIGSPTVILPPLARRCPEIDLEELRRGRRRDKHGGWRGKDPKIVPKAIHDEWVSRQFEQVHQELADAVLPAVKRLGAIATADFVDHDIQLKAIEMILVRVFGKPDTKVNIQAEGPPRWMDAMLNSVVDLVALPEDHDMAGVLDVPSSEAGYG